MIDIENKIVDTVTNAVTAIYADCLVVSVPTRNPAEFPCVSIYEADNAVYQPARTLSEVETHASLMYEVNVYSNLEYGRKGQAKDIAAVVDATMEKLGFQRTFKSPLPNEDVTIYRLTMRYKATVSQAIINGTKYIYKIYQ